MMFYAVNLNLNMPHVWHIDTAGRDPKWLVDAINTMADAIQHFAWAQDQQGIWWLTVEWSLPYDHDAIYLRLSKALLDILDDAVVLHGVA